MKTNKYSLSRSRAIAVLLLIITVSSIVLPSLVLADINSDMQRFVDGLGIHGNAGGAGVYESQSGGYFSGGGFSVRYPARTITLGDLVQLQPPHISGACGNFDAYFGGLSYFNEDMIEQLIKDKIQQSKMYLIMLALKILLPSVEKKISEVLAQIQKYTQFALGSCEQTAAVASAAIVAATHENEESCVNYASAAGYYQDQAEARLACKQGGSFGEILKKLIKQNPEYHDNLWARANVAWRALRKSGYIANSNDQRLAEFFMSITGTLVIDTPTDCDQGDDPQCDPSRPVYQRFPSLLDDQMIAALTGLDETRQQVRVYRCKRTTSGALESEFGCLDLEIPDPAPPLPAGATFGKRILDELVDMRTRIKSGIAPTDSQKSLLGATKYPIYRYLNVTSFAPTNVADTLVRNVATLLATEIAYTYVEANISLVEQMAGSMPIPKGIADTFAEQIRDVRDRLRPVRDRMELELNSTEQFADRVLRLERRLLGELDRKMIANVRWTSPYVQ